LKVPKAYIDFLIHFHGDRDYFECHEILEHYWKQTEPDNRSSVWVGFIQLAVAQYHYRRKNDIGAKKLVKKSIEILKQRSIELTNLGIDTIKFYMLLEGLQTSYENGDVYKNINLPITNPHILSMCKKECGNLGLEWCSDDEIIPDFILHRHLHKNHKKN